MTSQPNEPDMTEQDKVKAARIERLIGPGFLQHWADGATKAWPQELINLVRSLLTDHTARGETIAAQAEEIERLKVENVNLLIAFDMADESRETFFRQTKDLSTRLAEREREIAAFGDLQNEHANLMNAHREVEARLAEGEAREGALMEALEKSAKRCDLRALVAQRSFSTVIGHADKNMYWAEKRAFEEAAGFVRSEFAALTLKGGS